MGTCYLKQINMLCYVMLNYYGAPASALVASEKPKLVLCFTTYCKIVSDSRRRFSDDSLY